MGEHDESTAFVGMGSNLGDRLALLRSAVRALRRNPACRVIKTSPVFETRPVGPSSRRYLNAALRLSTTLAPRALLDLLHEIEDAHGRVRSDRWGARTLDLDLLLFTKPRSRRSVCSSEPTLQLPHPRLLQRDFVLEPLLHIAPNLSLNRTPATAYLRALRTQDRTVLRRLPVGLDAVDRAPARVTFAQL